MAYRKPRFCHLHAVRDVGYGAITLSHSEDSAFPKANMIDDRTADKFSFSSGEASKHVDVDLGAGFVTGIERVIIPADHNLTSIRVGDDDSGSWPSVNWLHTAQTVVPGTQIDEEFTPSTQRYIYFGLLNAATHYLRELFLTEILTFTPGPNLANSLDSHRANVTRLEQPTGQSPTVEHGPQQRVIEYDYDSPLSGADLVAMEAFIADVGLTHPFYVDPHSFSATPAVDDPPLLMKFAEMPVSRLAVTVPFSGLLEKTFKLKLIESVE